MFSVVEMLIERRVHARTQVPDRARIVANANRDTRDGPLAALAAQLEGLVQPPWLAWMAVSVAFVTCTGLTLTPRAGCSSSASCRRKTRHANPSHTTTSTTLTSANRGMLK